MHHGHAPHDQDRHPLASSVDPSWVHRPSSEENAVWSWSHVSLDLAGKQVLSDVSLWVNRGELTCLCGSNGAGKTQLIRVGLGFSVPRLGKVTLLGDAPTKSRHRVGYVPQQKSFNRNFPATVEDVLVAAYRGVWPLWPRRTERDLAANTLQRVGALPLLDKDVGVLSGGELQRVFMARALMASPEILVLDEPMAAVDTKGRGSLVDLMVTLRNEQKLTILLITHSQALVSHLADRVVFFERGKLVGWGLPSQVLEIEALRQVAFFGHDHEGVIDGGEG